MSFHIQTTRDRLQLLAHRVSSLNFESGVSKITLKAQDKQLAVEAFDRFTSVFVDLDAEETQAGEQIAVPIKMFVEIIKELPQGPVQLERIDSNLSIRGGLGLGFEIRIPLLEHGSIKPTSLPKFSEHISIPCQILGIALEQVDCAILVESPQPFGSLAYFHRPQSTGGGKRGLRFIGTDSYKLALCDLNLEGIPPDFLPKGVCFTKRGIGDLTRLVAEGFENVKLAVSLDQSTLSAEVPGFLVLVRLSSVDYPPYEGVLPNLEKFSSIEINKNALMGALKRVMLAADKAKTLTLQFESEQLIVKTSNGDQAFSQEAIPLKGGSGNGCDIKINGRYLLDVLSHVLDETVLLYNSGSRGPIVVKAKTPRDDYNSFHVVVPIQQV